MRRNNCNQEVPAGEKFTESTKQLKRVLREIRIKRGLNMKQGAEMIGVTRKSLEDIETTRPYGRYINAELLQQYADKYNVDIVIRPNP